MDWRNRITSDPEILAGQSVVIGTRLSVDLVVGLLAQGWSEADVLRNYPRLTGEDIQACLDRASAEPSEVPLNGEVGAATATNHIGVYPT
jgi:uncharacterized protein (DUF433 family)